MKKSIEVDFDKLTEEINKHLNDATVALNKAAELANSAEVSLTSYSYDNNRGECVDNFNYRELFDALENAGWSTSSLKC